MEWERGKGVGVEIGKEGRGEEAGGRWGEGRVKLNGRCGLDGELGWHWDYGIGFQEVVTIRAWLLCQGWKWKAISNCRLDRGTPGCRRLALVKVPEIDTSIAHQRHRVISGQPSKHCFP